MTDKKRKRKGGREIERGGRGREGGREREREMEKEKTIGERDERERERERDMVYGPTRKNFFCIFLE